MQPTRKTSAPNDVMQQTLHNPAFINCLRSTVLMARDTTFSTGNPTWLSGYVGQEMYYQSINFGSQALREHGFSVKQSDGQLIIVNDTSYGSRVAIRVASGRMLHDTLLFNWPKGSSTMKAIRQNQEFLHADIQLSLFGSMSTSTSEHPRLNLWIVNEISQDHLSSWLAIGARKINPLIVRCSDFVEICNETFDHSPEVDTIVSIDSEYDMPFEEKQDDAA